MTSSSQRLPVAEAEELATRAFQRAGVSFEAARDAAEILNAIALEHRAEQIVVARGSEGGFASRAFGTVAIKLVSSASVPVTVVS